MRVILAREALYLGAQRTSHCVATGRHLEEATASPTTTVVVIVVVPSASASATIQHVGDGLTDLLLDLVHLAQVERVRAHRDRR